MTADTSLVRIFTKRSDQQLLREVANRQKERQTDRQTTGKNITSLAKMIIMNDKAYTSLAVLAVRGGSLSSFAMFDFKFSHYTGRRYVPVSERTVRSSSRLDRSRVFYQQVHRCSPSSRSNSTALFAAHSVYITTFISVS